MVILSVVGKMEWYLRLNCSQATSTIAIYAGYIIATHRTDIATYHECTYTNALKSSPTNLI